MKIDGTILKNVLSGLGVEQECIELAMPVLLGETSRPNGGLMDVPTACRFLGGISRWTIQRAVDSGNLASVRIGVRVMFDQADLNAFIRAHRVPQAKQTDVRRRTA